MSIKKVTKVIERDQEPEEYCSIPIGVHLKGTLLWDLISKSADRISEITGEDRQQLDDMIYTATVDEKDRAFMLVPEKSWKLLTPQQQKEFEHFVNGYVGLDIKYSQNRMQQTERLFELTAKSHNNLGWKARAYYYKTEAPKTQKITHVLTYLAGPEGAVTKEDMQALAEEINTLAGKDIVSWKPPSNRKVNDSYELHIPDANMDMVLGNARIFEALINKPKKWQAHENATNTIGKLVHRNQVSEIQPERGAGLVAERLNSVDPHGSKKKYTTSHVATTVVDPDLPSPTQEHTGKLDAQNGKNPGRNFLRS